MDSMNSKPILNKTSKSQTHSNSSSNLITTTSIRAYESTYGAGIDKKAHELAVSRTEKHQLDIQACEDMKFKLLSQLGVRNGHADAQAHDDVIMEKVNFQQSMITVSESFVNQTMESYQNGEFHQGIDNSKQRIGKNKNRVRKHFNNDDNPFTNDKEMNAERYMYDQLAEEVIESSVEAEHQGRFTRIDYEAVDLERRKSAVRALFDDESCMFTDDLTQQFVERCDYYARHKHVNEWILKPIAIKFKFGAKGAIRNSTIFVSRRTHLNFLHKSFNFKTVTIKSNHLCPNLMNAQKWYTYVQLLMMRVKRNDYFIFDGVALVDFIIITLLRINFSCFNHCIFGELFNYFSYFKILDNLFVLNFLVEHNNLDELYKVMRITQRMWNNATEIYLSTKRDYGMSEEQAIHDFTTIVVACTNIFSMKVETLNLVADRVKEFIDVNVSTINVQYLKLKEFNTHNARRTLDDNGFYSPIKDLGSAIVGVEWQHSMRMVQERIPRKADKRGGHMYTSLFKSSLWDLFIEMETIISNFVVLDSEGLAKDVLRYSEELLFDSREEYVQYKKYEENVIAIEEKVTKRQIVIDEDSNLTPEQLIEKYGATGALDMALKIYWH